MKQDWVVWLGCTLLLCIGAIWGAIPIGTDFFKVKDVHDLFEIFSSVATILAVGVALVGVNTWRQQVSGEADHALAHRVAVAALKYKETARAAFSDAQFAVTQFKVGMAELPEGLLDRFVIPMESRLRKNQDSKAEFLAILLEARAIWGLEFSSKYDELLNFTESFYGCLRSFFRWVRTNDGDHNAEFFSTILQRYYDEFERNDWLIRNAAQVPTFDELTKGADGDLQRKLLRST